MISDGISSKLFGQPRGPGARGWGYLLWAKLDDKLGPFLPTSRVAKCFSPCLVNLNDDGKMEFL